MAIDTLEVVKELKAAGFSDGQAEAVARVVSRTQLDAVAALATKDDLRALELKFEVKFAEIESKLAENKTDLLKWMMGAIGVQTIVIVSAVIALARALGG